MILKQTIAEILNSPFEPAMESADRIAKIALITEILYGVFGDDITDLIESTPTKSFRTKKPAAGSNCGTGSGGFKPGNQCQLGGKGGKANLASSTGHAASVASAEKLITNVINGKKTKASLEDVTKALSKLSVAKLKTIHLKNGVELEKGVTRGNIEKYVGEWYKYSHPKAAAKKVAPKKEKTKEKTKEKPATKKPAAKKPAEKTKPEKTEKRTVKPRADHPLTGTPTHTMHQSDFIQMSKHNEVNRLNAESKKNKFKKTENDKKIEEIENNSGPYISHLVQKHKDEVKYAYFGGKHVPDAILRAYKYSSWMPKSKSDQFEIEDKIHSAKSDMAIFKRSETYKSAVEGIDSAKKTLDKVHASVIANGKKIQDKIDAENDKNVRLRNERTALFHSKLKETDAKNLKKMNARQYEIEKELGASQIGNLEQEMRMSAWSAIGVSGTKKTEVKFNSKDVDDEYTLVKHFFSKTMEASAHGYEFKVEAHRLTEYDPYGSKRAYARDYAIHISRNEDAHTVAHEVGHVIDHHSGYGPSNNAFLLSKADHETVSHMGEGYKNHEVAIASNALHSKYSGKWYGEKSSEIVSVGVEQMYVNPVRFAQQSPEHFKYVAGVLRGDIRGENN